MNRQIDYEALTKRLEQTVKIAKKLGLQIVPCGGYAMDYSMDRLPTYPIGLFGALSIVEGPGARSRLGLTYLETVALEEGFNSVQYQASPIRLMKKYKRKKDETWLKLEAIGQDLAKKVVQYTNRSTRPKKKKRQATYRSTSSSAPSRFAAMLDQSLQNIPAPPSYAEAIEQVRQAMDQGMSQAWAPSGPTAMPAAMSTNIELDIAIEPSIPESYAADNIAYNGLNDYGLDEEDIMDEDLD